MTGGPCDPNKQWRSADGTCNNIDNPLWGGIDIYNLIISILIFIFSCQHCLPKNIVARIQWRSMERKSEVRQWRKFSSLLQTGKIDSDKVRLKHEYVLLGEYQHCSRCWCSQWAWHSPCDAVGTVCGPWHHPHSPL